MLLHADDIALIRQIIREEVRAANSEDLRLQAEYLVTLPIEERKRLAKEQMAAERRNQRKGVSA
jgi:hypothetical protein